MSLQEGGDTGLFQPQISIRWKGAINDVGKSRDFRCDCPGNF